MVVIKKDIIYDENNNLKTDIYFPNDTESHKNLFLRSFSPGLRCIAFGIGRNELLCETNYSTIHPTKYPPYPGTGLILMVAI